MCKSIYCININTNREKHIKACNTCLEFQQMHSKEMIIHHDILLRPWKVLGMDIFHLNNKNYLCTIDYHSKFPVLKRMEGLSAGSLITTIKVIFAEYGIPHTLAPILFQRNSEISAAVSISSKYCCNHITINATDRSKPASNLLNAL